MADADADLTRAPSADADPAALLVDRLPGDVEAAVKALLQAACDRNLMLATAESCTGGLLSALLTDVEGCSHAFDRGFVAYSEASKAEMLGVERALIDTEGAVSRAVALAMADAALTRSAAHVALAVTGFAGEAAPGEEPGLVHFACVRRGRAPVHREAHFGDRGRAAVRIETVRVAAAMMMDALD